MTEYVPIMTLTVDGGWGVLAEKDLKTLLNFQGESQNQIKISHLKRSKISYTLDGLFPFGGKSLNSDFDVSSPPLR